MTTTVITGDGWIFIAHEKLTNVKLNLLHVARTKVVEKRTKKKHSDKTSKLQLKKG